MATFDVIDPRTGVASAQVDATGVHGVNGAVQAAHSALADWSTTDLAVRVAAMRDVVARWVNDRDRLVELVQAEVGQPERFTSTVHVDGPLRGATRIIDLVDDVEWRRTVDTATVERVPLGVVAALTPWNYPVHQVVAKVVPALLAGCVVVLKPSEMAPLSAQLLVDGAADVLPPGVLTVVQGEGLVEGAALATHHGVDHVSFTGSVDAGRAVAAAAIRHGASAALELGGKSAAVLLPDLSADDFARAARYVVADCMSNAGQTCTALTRLIVPESRLDEAVAAVTTAAARFAPGGLLGPVRTADAVDRLREAIDDGEARGATVHVDGRDVGEDEPGFWFGPTIVSVDNAADPLATEELFGPVLTLLNYDDAGSADASDERALALVDASAFDLSAAVWGADSGRVERFASRVRTGQVRIQGAPFDYGLPFGGFGGSGFGREWGREGIESFTTTRTLLR